MKKTSIKIFVILSLVILVTTITLSVNAITSLDNSSSAKNTVSNFLDYIEYGSSYTLNYIDSHNAELYSKTQDKLNSYSTINYEITKVKQKGDTYKVEAKISAEGTNWKVNGITADFDVEYVNGSYRITDTNFFEITSPEYIAGMAVGIVGIVFLVIGIIFVVFIVAIIVIVVIVVKSSKKK